MKKKKLLTGLIKYLISFAVAGLCVYGILVLKDFRMDLVPSEKYRLLSDAFTIPGVFFLGIGLLVFFSNEGAFTGLGYSLSWFFHMFISFSIKKMESYHDYVMRKREKGGVKGFGFLLVTGLVLMACAVVFILLFHKVTDS